MARNALDWKTWGDDFQSVSLFPCFLLDTLPDSGDRMFPVKDRVMDDEKRMVQNGENKERIVNGRVRAGKGRRLFEKAMN